jgi:hypothetical protein
MEGRVMGKEGTCTRFDVKGKDEIRHLTSAEISALEER